MKHHTDNQPAKLSENEASAGRKTGYMRYVLAISLGAAVLIALFWLFSAMAVA